MLYDQFIRLMNLKPCKWYNFIRKGKNYKLIYDVFYKVTEYVNTNWADNKIETLLEFAQCVHALQSLVSDNITHIKVYGLNDAENRAYGCSSDIVSIDLGNTIVDLSIKVTIYRTQKRMTVTYMDPKLSRSFNFTIYNGSDDTRISKTDKFVLFEILDCVNIYITTITEFLVNKYT